MLRVAHRHRERREMAVEEGAKGDYRTGCLRRPRLGKHRCHQVVVRIRTNRVDFEFPGAYQIGRVRIDAQRAAVFLYGTGSSAGTR